jgi:hypothetical protein
MSRPTQWLSLAVIAVAVLVGCGVRARRHLRAEAGMTVTLTLPMPENVGNARLHWRTKNRAKNDYLAACDALQARNAVPAPPPVPLARATIAAVMVLGNAMDDDNAMARLKWPIDWLVRRGYIADDRRTCLTWAGPRRSTSRASSRRA